MNFSIRYKCLITDYCSVLTSDHFDILFLKDIIQTETE